MRVSLNVLAGNQHGRLCLKMGEGIAAAGDSAVARTEKEWSMDGFDAAVLWGFTEPCQRVVRECQEKGIPWVFLDLAYWGRDKHFKVTVNDRHPTAYMMDKPMPSGRFEALGLKVQPWKRDGNTILVAGMSGKAAWAWGLQETMSEAPQRFEREAVHRALETAGGRGVLYRAKPSFAQAQAIPGAMFDRVTPIDTLLRDAWCVVQHHSNVGCDALLAGVPVFTRYGAARHLALPVDDGGPALTFDASNPVYPDGREQWAANLAYCQWTVEEMCNGACWRHMRALIADGV